MHRRPASITLHFELSIMIGTRAMSGSLAIRLRKRTIAASLSSMASSMLMSMICAPFSTCWRATIKAASKSPFKIIRAKAFEPVTLVRSPILTNRLPEPTVTGSRPDSFMAGTGQVFFRGFMRLTLNVEGERRWENVLVTSSTQASRNHDLAATLLELP